MASSRARNLARLATGFLVLILAGPAGAARASEPGKKKIVVLDFVGPLALRAQRDVVKLLRPNATLVPAKVYVDAASTVNGYRPDPAGVATVAKQIQVHGVVVGRVRKRGRRFNLTVRVLEGRSGEAVVDGITLPLQAGRLNPAGQRKLARELKLVLNELPDPVGQQASDEPVAAASNGGEEKGDEKSVAAAGAGTAASAGGRRDEEHDEQVAERPPGKKVAAADAPASRGANRSEAEVRRTPTTAAATEQADRRARGRALDASAGISFISRKLTFSFVDGLQDLPQGYDGAFVPGVYAAVELYPVALADRQARGLARNIGVTLELDKALLIKSELPGQAGADSLPTSQGRYGGGLVYRWNFGSRPTSPTLKLVAGYNVLSFAIDESQAANPATVELPDVSYSYIDPGLAFRLPLGDQVVALAEAHYLYLLSAGDFEAGDNYGDASVLAFDADVGAEVRVTGSIRARAGARYSQFGMKFDGSGDLTDRTNDGMQDVTSASDRYLGFYATAGFVF